MKQPRRPASHHDHPTHREGVELINSALRPDGGPVLGLHIYTGYFVLLKSLTRNPRYRNIRPHLIGTPSILSVRPGISQTELAQYLGGERATVGLQVRECMRRGWVRRAVAASDKRRYELHITPAGRRMLADVVAIVASHEKQLAASLTERERSTLRTLLVKIIPP